VPADLEARLLAAIPTRRRRWAVWAGVGGALAAACVLAVLAWPRRAGNLPDTRPGPGVIVHAVPALPPDDSDSVTAWRVAQQVLDGADLPTFNWPVQETSPTTVTSAPA